MKRRSSLLFMLAFVLSAASALASIQLDIAPRKQWNNRYGYCGECSIQQAALYFGAYISLRVGLLQPELWLAVGHPLHERQRHAV